MQFLYPSFLWALLALAIPVIIHLFYFRKFKRVYFTNVKYLKEIKEETSNRNKLKNLLVLLSRCLAVAGLVFAFAQPFIPTTGTIKAGINHVSVFVDNSYSMTAKRDDIPLLDFAKERATVIINSYSEEDRFQVLTHDFEGRHQRFISKEDAISYIDEIKVTPSVQNISKILIRQKQLFETVGNNRVSYIISDFQKSISDYDIFRDTSFEINLLPLQTSQQKNLSVDSLWFDGPIPFFNQNNKLVVRIKNNSGENAEQVKISFKKEGQEKPIGIRDIPANSYITDTVVINIDKSGWHNCIVNVTDYPVQFDDEYYISFEVPDTIKALVINETGANRFMDALFKGVKYFSLNSGLIRIPPLNLQLNLSYTFGKLWKIHEIKTVVGISYDAKQTHIDPTEDFLSPPDDFYLINVSTKFRLKTGNGNDIDIQIRAENLLNNSYRQYLNRLRYFADETGSNFSLNIKSYF